MNSNRRVFVLQSVTCAGALAALALPAGVSAQALVSESDAQATALGYKADGTKVDKAKFPKYAAGQTCGNCAVFQGKAADAAGNCPLFPGKTVSTKGWCSAYAKKA
jgi:High potential iron-sulfur protein